MLRQQRAIEIVPSGKPLRWRRYDVPQHLAPKTSDALRFCAVEGDLELLDRSHLSTIEARGSHAVTGLANLTGAVSVSLPRRSARLRSGPGEPQMATGPPRPLYRGRNTARAAVAR